ncbi:hypothetical protein PMAYCL1PPCAC_04010, partial [Pristionchus mayeri]
ACPGPSDPPSHTYCCTIPWNGVSRPTCCSFPVYTGVVVVLPLVTVAAIGLIVFLWCHFWDDSPLNIRRARM